MAMFALNMTVMALDPPQKTPISRASPSRPSRSFWRSPMPLQDMLMGDGRRPALATQPPFATSPYWRDLLLFYEYFHADTGQGLVAAHQTG
jgi:hypothetical protein